jgi:hypothetical protein
MTGGRRPYPADTGGFSVTQLYTFSAGPDHERYEVKTPYTPAAVSLAGKTYGMPSPVLHGALLMLVSVQNGDGLDGLLSAQICRTGTPDAVTLGDVGKALEHWTATRCECGVVTANPPAPCAYAEDVLGDGTPVIQCDTCRQAALSDI